jgi:hypothetical protein
VATAENQNGYFVSTSLDEHRKLLKSSWACHEIEWLLHNTPNPLAEVGRREGWYAEYYTSNSNKKASISKWCR